MNISAKKAVAIQTSVKRARKYYYIVRCENGIQYTETVEYASNHWDAEKQAEEAYFEQYQQGPVEVSSRKITKTEANNISI